MLRVEDEGEVGDGEVAVAEVVPAATLLAMVASTEAVVLEQPLPSIEVGEEDAVLEAAGYVTTFPPRFKNMY